MTAVRIAAFGGLQPRTSDRLLADNAATHAENIKIYSGELRPLNKPRIVYTPNKTLPPKSIYRARSENSSGWLSWPIDVDVVRVPLSADVESRYCWTGDGEPKIAKHTEAISGGNDDYPHTCHALGIPTPKEKPAVAPSGGTSTTVDRFYCATFFSELGEESAPSPVSDRATGKVDGTFAVTNLPAFPLNSGTGTGVYSGGVTTFTNGSSIPHWLRKGDPIIIGGNTVTVSDVSSSTVFKVPGDYSAASSWARVTYWNTVGMKRRLYRTTGTSGSWQLVSDDVGTTYNDTLTDSQILGDELISEGWEPPPAGLKGLCVHSSGALAGFVGNQVWMTEPLQPHAWSNIFSSDYPIVGLAPFGSSIAVATEGNPSILDGVEPASMSPTKIDGLYPCVSKRSVISIGNGALYSTNHGLVSISTAGVSIFTEAFYTRDEWIKLCPSSMICEYTNGLVYCAYTTALGEAEILAFGGGVLITVGIQVSDLYADQSTGDLYLGMDDGIYLFDPAEQSYPMTSAWRSKDFTFPAPLNLGAAKIDFKVAIDPAALLVLLAEREAAIALNEGLLAAGGFYGAMNFAAYNEREVNGSEAYQVPSIPPSNEIQFTLRSEDRVIFQRIVSDNKAFRLPSGIKYDSVSVEISCQGKVSDIRLAETMSGLKVT